MRPTVHLHGVLVEKARTFAAIAHSPEFTGAADFSDQRAPEQALEIERNIRAEGTRSFDPWPEGPGRVQPAEFAARKNVNVVHVRISAQERGPFGIDHPGDFRAG